MRWQESLWDDNRLNQMMWDASDRYTDTDTDTHVMNKGIDRRPALTKTREAWDDKFFNQMVREGSDKYTDTDTPVTKKVLTKGQL